MLGVHRAAAALVVLLALVSLTACAAGDLVSVQDTVLVTWEEDSGSTAGQVIVTVTNEADGTVDPDIFGRGSQTSVVLLDEDGEGLPGDSRIQLHAVPQTLEPGESGYLLAEFRVPTAVADVRLELNADDAPARDRVDVTGFELVDSSDGLGAQGRLEWDGEGSAAARAIALDDEGRPLGYAGTAEVRYDVGDVTMCCFPPSVELSAVDDVAVFGIKAIDET